MKKKVSGAFAVFGFLIASLGFSIPAANAQPASTAGSMSMEACEQLAISYKYGRTAILWKCGAEYHGQVLNGSPGDLIYLNVGGNGAGGVVIPAGSNTANS
ncbi:hypothetical protein [Haematomicrobium sanguinis]|uniref:hypothetical protein n=1 Tax=Haematomicrobium sanguinis TaxID=479106 RepID=UPI00047DCC57|nr:hypothetical protein [Haematomicrobium sanguinis]